MQNIENKPSILNKKFIAIGFVFLIAITIIYIQQRSLTDEEEMYQNSMVELKGEMQFLKNELKQLRSNNRSLGHIKDSLEGNLQFLWGYKTLVKTARLRDKVGEDLPYKSGERVRMKADSSIVVITDLIVGGNTFNYYIKYLVKTPKGLALDVSPFEIESIK